MRSYEIGIRPESTCFYFSPTAQTRKIYYYQIGCGHYYCTDEYYIKRDTYSPLLLVYVVGGTFCLELGKETHRATAGQVVFFDCQQPHHYYTDHGAEFLYLHFDGPAAHELCRQINKASGIVIESENNKHIRERLESLVQLYESGGNESVFANSARVYEIFSLLDNPVVSPRLRKNDESILRTIGHIRANVGKKISLHELAEISELSDYYFSHIFKEMTGQSPSEFIIHSRIDQAKALLVNSELSVMEIAREVGYPNSSNLITLFAQRVGCSPMQFRKTHRASSISAAHPITRSNEVPIHT